MKQAMKEAYVAPTIEVIKMENEGVIAASGGSNSIPDFGNGGGVGTPTQSYKSYNATNSDLEDMINDILTIEN